MGRALPSALPAFSSRGGCSGVPPCRWRNGYGEASAAPGPRPPRQTSALVSESDRPRRRSSLLCVAGCGQRRLRPPHPRLSQAAAGSPRLPPLPEPPLPSPRSPPPPSAALLAGAAAPFLVKSVEPPSASRGRPSVPGARTRAPRPCSATWCAFGRHSVQSTSRQRGRAGGFHNFHNFKFPNCLRAPSGRPRKRGPAAHALRPPHPGHSPCRRHPQSRGHS